VTAHRVRRLLLKLMPVGMMIAALPARGQTRTTRVVVGFAPGGPVDLVARMIAEQLGKELGTQVIVENKPGANAGIAAETVARAIPDGGTLFLTSTGAVAISPALYEKLTYDPVKDLAPVSLLVNTAEVLVASATNPASDAVQFIANARQKKEGVAMASSGIGSVPHLALELLADVTKVNLRHIPYKGVAPAISDVIAGHVEALFIDVPVALGHIKSGKLKALAIAAPSRHPMLPDTRTLDEMGIRGVDSNNWYGIYTSAAVPATEIERVSQAVRHTLENESVRNRLLASGLEPAPTTPAQLAALQKADTEKWARIIKLKNIKGE
jgi:tripartite-type tricarboxylate transporter receptor subunit TctC